MKTITRTRSIGGSLVVTIPKEIVKEEGIQNGELIGIEIEKIKKSGFGLLKGKLGKFKQEDKLDTEL